MKKTRLQELAGMMTEASVSQLDAAVKDKVAYKKFIDAMDVLLDDWYAAGFTKQDVVDYMDGILPDGGASTQKKNTRNPWLPSKDKHPWIH